MGVTQLNGTGELAKANLIFNVIKPYTFMQLGGLSRFDIADVSKVLGLSLVGLHLVLTWQVIGQTDQFMLNVLLWSALITLVSNKQYLRSCQSSRIATGLGVGLVFLICLKSVSLFAYESAFVTVLPGLIFLSLGLIVTGFKVIRHWQEALLITTLMVPLGATAALVRAAAGNPIQLLLAQSATFLLHYVGFDVFREGINVVLPFGAVSVEYQCTGIPILVLLLQLSVPLRFLFQTSWPKFLMILGAAFSITFGLSSIRIVIMALSVANETRFDYWHGAAGGQIFSTIAIALFSGLCLWLIE